MCEYKRKALIILTQEEYKQNSKAFLQENQFVTINKNPRQFYQQEIKQTLKHCVNVWKYTNTNLTAPSMHAPIELPKPNITIRPIINWINAPACEIAKTLTTRNYYLNLPYTYTCNVLNSNHLMTEVETIELNSDTKICTQTYQEKIS